MPSTGLWVPLTLVNRPLAKSDPRSIEIAVLRVRVEYFDLANDLGIDPMPIAQRLWAETR